MLQLHFVGGIEYMMPITIVLMINLTLLTITIIKKMKHQTPSETHIILIRELGIFAGVFGIFGTMVGLYQAFGDLSRMTETLPFNVIMGGLQVALITALWGSIVCLLSIAAFVGLRWTQRNS